MSLARLREDQKQCAVCGSAGGLCACTATTSALSARAEALSRAATAAAGRGELHRALEAGREALTLDGSSAKLWHLVGVTALSLGEVRQAITSLHTARSLDPTGDAAELLRSIESGAIHETLTRYNQALSDATAHRIDDALALADTVTREMPGFVPAARLLGLLHADRGRLVKARAIWAEALDTCRDDRELLRYLASTGEATGHRHEPPSVRPLKARGYFIPATIAAVLVAALALVASTRRPASAPASDTVRVPFATREDTIALARSLGQILAAESDSAVDALRALEPHMAQWPDAAKARVASISQQRGRQHFESGRTHYNSGRWKAAARDLSWAVTYGTGSEYHAEAMYLLARSHARSSQPASAKIEAQELLRLYPKSRYADAVMRSMAVTGHEP